jgi:hypothetical protein
MANRSVIGSGKAYALPPLVKLNWRLGPLHGKGLEMFQNTANHLLLLTHRLSGTKLSHQLRALSAKALDDMASAGKRAQQNQPEVMEHPQGRVPYTQVGVAEMWISKGSMLSELLRIHVERHA